MNKLFEAIDEYFDSGSNNFSRKTIYSYSEYPFHIIEGEYIYNGKSYWVNVSVEDGKTEEYSEDLEHWIFYGEYLTTYDKVGDDIYNDNPYADLGDGVEEAMVRDLLSVWNENPSLSSYTDAFSLFESDKKLTEEPEMSEDELVSRFVGSLSKSLPKCKSLGDLKAVLNDSINKLENYSDEYVIESALTEEVENLGKLSAKQVKELDWADGNIACYKLDNLTTEDFINISRDINKASKVFMMNNYLCIYADKVNSLGGRHFSDFQDSVSSYK